MNTTLAGVLYLPNNMIITNLKGGLGNQMFQYALGKKMSLKNNDELKLDTTGLDMAEKVGDEYRPFELDAFNIQSSIASEQEIAKIRTPLGFVSKIVNKFRFKILRQMHIGWEPETLNKTGDMYLDGFWQSYKYFEDIREELLQDFSLKSPVSLNMQSWIDKVSEVNSVSLHVRKGDYASNPRVLKEFGTCSEDYYNTAISYLEENSQDPHFFIFSDDIDWVRRNLSLPGKVTFVSDKSLTTAEELILMSKCSHNIIANSSFSWWGAWLNSNAKKIVIAPTPWFNKKSHVYKDLIPAEWTTLQRD